jgi:hypothetical protein
MPTVPQDAFVQDVMPGQVRPTGGLQPERLDVTPAMFGGQVGETLQQSGNMLEQHAQQRQQLINKSKAEDLFSTQYVPAMAQLANDFYSLKGQEAEDSYKDYVQKLIDLQHEYQQKLPGQMSQFIFDEYSKNWNAREIERMSRHAAEQSNAFQARATDSMVNTYVLDGQNHYYDPNSLKQNHAQIIHSLNFYGTTKNVDQPTTDLKVNTAVDKMYYGAIWNQAQVDPAAATDMLQKYGKYMNANSVMTLQNKIAGSASEQRRTAEDYAARYTYGAFNLGQGGDINQATSWITNPDNYAKLGIDSKGAEGVASQLQAQWQREHHVQDQAYKQTNDHFDRMVIENQIPPDQLISWTDPKTGLQPDAARVRQAQGWMAHPPSISHSYPDTLVNLTNDVLDRRLLDKGPINQAFFQGKLTEADWHKLTDLQTTSQDLTKSRWFDWAKTAFNSKYADANGPNGVSADALQYFPRYLTDLDQAIRDQNLKGTQIRDAANKMLEDVDRAAVSRAFYNPAGWFGGKYSTGTALDYVKEWGGWPVPQINQPNRDPFSLWVAEQLQARGKPVTDGNITQMKKNLLAQDPEIEKHYQTMTFGEANAEK